jgi:hypothetical protein
MPSPIVISQPIGCRPGIKKRANAPITRPKINHARIPPIVMSLLLLQKLETLRIYDWSKITNNTYIPAAFTNSFSTTNTAHGVTYNGMLTVAPFAPPTGESYNTTLRQVTASVSWFSDGMMHTQTMTTLVSKNGIETYKP